MPKRHTVKPDEYHLIDIVTGESHGGFISLEAARLSRALVAGSRLTTNSRYDAPERLTFETAVLIFSHLDYRGHKFYRTV